MDRGHVNCKQLQLNLLFVYGLLLLIQVLLKRKVTNLLFRQILKLTGPRVFITHKRIKRKKTTAPSTNSCSCCQWLLRQVPRQIVQLICNKVFVACVFIFLVESLVNSFLTIILISVDQLFLQGWLSLFTVRLVLLCKRKVSFYVRYSDLLLRKLIYDSFESILLFCFFLSDFGWLLVLRPFQHYNWSECFFLLETIDSLHFLRAIN